ncbi:MAG TPA: thioredoxin domain-containing protein [Draconibacterium sp.]|nr:thioredoxin domain-containing protein [Draconibacterium sp.]
MKNTNALIHSTSPYLLQHAHNPVNWFPWSDEVVQKAKREDKLILVSIGYAACHWCHVMEHECFEDEEVAATMNKHFVSVKVDREERPEVDHYYMSAVQLMMQNGGWPLNVIALPDGRPIWGGTYFPKERWMDSLNAVAEYYKNHREKTLIYASQLEEGIKRINLDIEIKEDFTLDSKLIQSAVESWKARFDMQEGGRVGQPKFPMPVNLEFLLNYGVLKDDKLCLDFVKLTLEKMARGGIFDQIGGGFARYSVDEIWKVPHFEKMLYDNGQLLSIYSKAYQHFRVEEFKCTVYEIIDFLEREMLDSSGAFYSSLDADSDGEEGKFYVWQKPELRMILQEEYSLFSEFYNLNTSGLWENRNYILTRGSDDIFAKRHKLSKNELRIKVGKWKYKLLSERSKRVRPGLDDKTLTSWNALVIIGLVDAYRAFGEEHFLQLALRNAKFISEQLVQNSGQIFHNWKNGKATIEGFLEDYALVIKAWLALYEVTGDEKWLQYALQLNDYVFRHFYDSNSGLFYFTEKDGNQLVGNHFQNEDNVIPASNSVMANNLHQLYLIQGNPRYLEIAKRMTKAVAGQFPKYPMAYANWGNLMLKLTEPYYEVVVTGINANLLLSDLQNGFYPNVMWLHSQSQSEVPLLKDRFVMGDDLIYVCSDGSCQLPVKTAEEALKLLLR